MSVTQSSGSPPRPSLRERQSEHLRALLLETAASLVARDGDRVTMRSVADEVGCSIGALYRQFPSKSVLLDHVRARRLEALGAAADPARTPADRAEPRAATPVANLRQVIAACRLWSDGDPGRRADVAFARALLTERALTHLEPSSRPPGFELIQPLVGALEDAAATGGPLDPGDAALRAVAIVAVVPVPMLLPASVQPVGGPRREEVAGRLLVALLTSWGATPSDLRSAISSA